MLPPVRLAAQQLHTGAPRHGIQQDLVIPLVIHNLTEVVIYHTMEWLEFHIKCAHLRTSILHYKCLLLFQEQHQPRYHTQGGTAMMICTYLNHPTIKTFRSICTFGKASFF